ncbi:MAG TPA: baseplate J/gp47 family protein [Ktedonobacteraceae bacterium]|nr:baseplate J/gp47 family protein [Ktedonobacteraceae bacterium]
MADEQIIYLSPEEELTSVRERLEQVKARKIILVIPPQTHLRSHVGWRVLHGRMRDLGKEVLIISSDRQIRAVAKAVGFRVADSLESPSPNKSRPSRSGRTTGRGGRPTRDADGRPQRGLGGQPPRPTASNRGSAESRTQTQSQQPIQQQQGVQDFASSTFGLNEDEDELIEDEQIDPHSPEPHVLDTSSRYGSERDQSGPYSLEPEEYEFHIETSPPVSPRLPQIEEEEFPDPLIHNYQQANFIRQQFQAPGQHPMPPADAADVEELTSSPTPAKRPEDDQGGYIAGRANGGDPYGGFHYEADPQSSWPAVQDDDHDVYNDYLEDSRPVSLPEQHGSALVEDIDTGVADLSERPTDVLAGVLEDLGDEGNITELETVMEPWDEPLEDEMERPISPRTYGSRSPDPRSGLVHPQPPVPESDLDDDEMLPPVPDRSTQIRSPSQVRRSGVLPPAAVSNREPQPILTPQTRGGQPKPASTRARKPAKKARTVTVPPPQKKPATRAKTASQRKTNRKLLTAFVCVVILLLILAGLYIFLPSAQVTISLPSRSLTVSALHLSASTNTADKAHNTVASTVLTFAKSVTGTGNATGTSQVGNAKATGSVNFSNRGTQSVDVPTGTVLETSKGVQFVTTADALIPPPGSSSIPPIPVEAINAGNDGNVAAGSITVIPPASLTAIAQHNSIQPSALSLSVTNAQALTGGGAAAATSVTNANIQSEKTTLEKQLQAEFQTWLAPQVHTGDITGTPSRQAETVTTTPASGKVTQDGKFGETVSVRMTVLVVRAAALQAAAAGSLNARALQMKPANVLVAGQPVTLSKVKSTASKDGSTLAITLDATGQTIQRVSTDDLRNALAGRSIDQAKSDITGGLAGLRGVLHTNITVSPGFLTILPFRAEHITVILKPVPTSGVPNGP